MAHRPGRFALSIVAAALILACGAGLAGAHDGRAIEPVVAAATPIEASPATFVVAAASDPVLPGTLLAALACVALIALVTVPRRLVVAVVVPLLVLVAFEAGVHGVHHLGDPRAAAHCPVAVSAEHVAGAVVDVAADVAPTALVSVSVSLPDSPPPAGAEYRPGDGRAPPALLS